MQKLRFHNDLPLVLLCVSQHTARCHLSLADLLGQLPHLPQHCFVLLHLLLTIFLCRRLNRGTRSQYNSSSLTFTQTGR